MSSRSSRNYDNNRSSRNYDNRSNRNYSSRSSRNYNESFSRNDPRIIEPGQLPPPPPRKSAKWKWVSLGVLSLTFVIAVPVATFVTISILSPVNEKDGVEYKLTWIGPSDNDKTRIANDTMFTSTYILNHWMQIDKNYISKYGNPDVKINIDESAGKFTTTLIFDKGANVSYNGEKIIDSKIVFRTPGFNTSYIVNINTDHASVKAKQSDFAKSITTFNTSVTIPDALKVLTNDGVVIKDANDIIIDSTNNSSIISIKGTVVGGDVQIVIVYKIYPESDLQGSSSATITKNKFV